MNGFDFPKIELEGIWIEILMRGLTDPATYIPEIIGFIIVLAFILRSISSEEPHKHLTDEVVGLFEDFSEHYSHRYDLKNTPIIKFIRKHGKDNQNVLEVGGIMAAF